MKDKSKGKSYEDIKADLDRQDNYAYKESDSGLLLCDLDSLEAVEVFQANLELMKERIAFGVKSVEVKPSNTPGHFHGIVELTKPIPLFRDRIFYQVLLGSQPKRELLALCNQEQFGFEISFLARPGWKTEESCGKSPNH